MKKICHITGAGDICEKDMEQLKNINDEDIIIAADGGYLSLMKNGIRPDIIIGDFDSCSENKLDASASIPIYRLNPEKDYTDMHTSINFGLEKGFQTFYLYGATGGRIDHTLANIQLLSWLGSTGYSARMFGTRNIFDILHNNEITFPAGIHGYVSVFSLTDKSIGVYETGLKYPLDNATLTNTFPLGISNEFTDETACIKVTQGTLLIISPR